MKHLLPLLLLIFIAKEINAQLKIDSNYTLLMGDVEYKNGSSVMYWKLDSLYIKEISSSKICKLVSAEWITQIQGSVFRHNSFAEVETQLPMVKPKDKLYIEKVKLALGCFPPPKQIVFEVQ